MSFNITVPQPDVKGFLEQLACRRTQRTHYADWGNANIELLSVLLGRKIEDPTTPQVCVDYALAVGKDLTEGGWFYLDTGQIKKRDSQGTIHYAGGTIANREDLGKVKLPGLVEQFEHLDQVCMLASRVNLGVRADIASFFTEVYLGMGYERFFTALYDEPAFVEYYLDFALDRYLAVAQKVVEHPVTAVLVDSDLCDGHGPMIAPAMLEKLWLPRMEKFLAVFHAHEVPVIMHCDGNLSAILDYAVDLGVRAIHPIEPGCNDIVKLKERYTEQLCFIGNIDMEQTLMRSRPQDVRAEVKLRLDQLSTVGGYIVATSTSYFPRDLPIENFLALLEAVHQC